MNAKQVIVVRKDLQMRKGKISAQVAHASMAAILNVSKKENTDDGNSSIVIPIVKDSPLDNWLNGTFTKIVVYVTSEEELLDIYNHAKNENILCALIQDSGKTEFHGKPTYTCVAVGPDMIENVNKITSELKLL